MGGGKGDFTKVRAMVSQGREPMLYCRLETMKKHPFPARGFFFSEKKQTKKKKNKKAGECQWLGLLSS